MTRLVVVVPALGQKARQWSPLIQRLKMEPELAQSDWLLWDHRCGYFSFKSALERARELAARIEETWTRAGGYDEVILIGHSLGGVLVRQTYLLSAGIFRSHPNAAEWHGLVSRIVLFAGINRGFKPSNSMLVHSLVLFGRLVGIFRFMLASDLVFGSNFITDLRIQWIRYFAEIGDRAATVVQLLGTRDGVVSRNDSIDIEQFPNAFQKDVAGATHRNLYRLDKAEDPEARYQLLREAILSAVPPHEPFRTVTEKSPVVFVLHGMRAGNSGWVEQISSHISDRAPSAEIVKASYGDLSAIGLAMPGGRKRNIDWFQDQYSYYLARYPKATFHFIGHSNGTYLLGESLKQVAGMQFERVFLAGSVLPRDYPWRDRFDNGQLSSFRNDRSRKDIPVGILCSGLQGIRMHDVGTAGFDGFLFNDNRTEEVFFYDGGHGAPLEERNLDNIVDYILTGTGSPAQSQLVPLDRVSSAFRLFSRVAGVVSPLVTVAFLALNAAGLYWMIDAFAWWKLATVLIPDGIILLGLKTA